MNSPTLNREGAILAMVLGAISLVFAIFIERHGLTSHFYLAIGLGLGFAGWVRLREDV
jgi:hypothetical protein